MVNQVYRTLPTGKDQLLSEGSGQAFIEREAEYWSTELPNDQIKIRFNVVGDFENLKNIERA